MYLAAMSTFLCFLSRTTASGMIRFFAFIPFFMRNGLQYLSAHAHTHVMPPPPARRSIPVDKNCSGPYLLLHSQNAGLTASDREKFTFDNVE